MTRLPACLTASIMYELRSENEDKTTSNKEAAWSLLIDEEFLVDLVGDDHEMLLRLDKLPGILRVADDLPTPP